MPTPRQIEATNSATRVEVDQVLWTPPGVAPATHAELSWTPEALVCRLTTHESEPRTTFHRPNDPVHKDSCLEWFLAPWPGTGWYLNLEANSAGTLFAAFGTTERRDLLDPGLRSLVGSAARVDDEQWMIDYRVPRELLDRLAGLAGLEAPRLAAGTVLETNLYKCGDDTAAPHYLAWNPIVAETPQFHRPDQFGRLVLA